MRRYERVERRRVEVFMGRDKREKFEIYELDIFSFSFNLFVFFFFLRNISCRILRSKVID